MPMERILKINPTQISIPFREIYSLEKDSRVLVIPNILRIFASNSKEVFLF